MASKPRYRWELQFIVLHMVFEALRDLHHVHAVLEQNRLQLRVAEDLAPIRRVLEILLVDITPH